MQVAGLPAPEQKKKQPDPGGITAFCDPSGIGFTVDDEPVVSLRSTKGYGAGIPLEIIVPRIGHVVICSDLTDFTTKKLASARALR